jgi:holin-like protein
MITFASEWTNPFNMIKGLFYIFAFYFIGELISKLIGGFLPGSIIGMILLFLCLYFKIVRAGDVQDAATTITKNMAIFFVPTAVGLMAYGELLSKNFWAIFTAIALSTILTIATVALVQERFEKKRHKEEKEEPR